MSCERRRAAVINIFQRFVPYSRGAHRRQCIMVLLNCAACRDGILCTLPPPPPPPPPRPHARPPRPNATMCASDYLRIHAPNTDFARDVYRGCSVEARPGWLMVIGCGRFWDALNGMRGRASATVCTQFAQFALGATVELLSKVSILLDKRIRINNRITKFSRAGCRLLLCAGPGFVCRVHVCANSAGSGGHPLCYVGADVRLCWCD